MSKQDAYKNCERVAYR